MAFPTNIEITWIFVDPIAGGDSSGNGDALGAISQLQRSRFLAYEKWRTENKAFCVALLCLSKLSQVGKSLHHQLHVFRGLWTWPSRLHLFSEILLLCISGPPSLTQKDTVWPSHSKSSFSLIPKVPALLCFTCFQHFLTPSEYGSVLMEGSVCWVFLIFLQSLYHHTSQFSCIPSNTQKQGCFLLFCNQNVMSVS